MASHQYSNSVKLAAVLNRWASPLLDEIIASNFSSFPFIANIDNKVRSTGWVSPQWSLAQELAPMFNGMANYIIEPLLAQYIGNVPDAAIPKIAHGIVDSAIANGKPVSLFDGHVKIEVPDLKELKKLLRYNLPITDAIDYEVITNPVNMK